MKTTVNRKTLITAVSCTLLFFVFAAYCITQGAYIGFALPLAFFAVWMLIAKMDLSLMVIAFCTPFAIDWEFFSKMNLSMPTEPLMILFSVVFLVRLLLPNGDKKDNSRSSIIDYQFLKHPVTVAVLLGTVWMLLTAITSVIPWVSFKYLAARLWFIIPFYFAIAQTFRNPKRINQFLCCYGFGLAVVVIYSTIHTIQSPSDLQVLHRVMKPFYNDHTAYGAILSLFLPVFCYLAASAKGKTKLFYIICALLFLVGLIFSYSRAAWLSVLCAVMVYFIVHFRIRWYWIAVVVGIGVSFFFVNQSQIMYKMGKNQQDSALDIGEQIQSISNISTDASNLERLNRWACAFRIFGEHPVFGSGPGTYQHIYSRYQKSYQRSTISTDFGDLGNAHSEYIGPLTEQGVPGAIFVLCIFGLTFVSGLRAYRMAPHEPLGKLALALTLSLLTYYVHGFFNNFLDTDKLSVPFWALTAAIVAIEIKLKNEPSREKH
ncbi:MAG: O-antigen ligase family protein [Bacteroidales bacterium]|nr:O-antigen ligase family protein [Bacteroidales bacterium]